MNNYSWLEQKLHKFALSSNFMREVTFDVEQSLFLNKEHSDNHVFIAGLARSGTTVLLNAIYQSDEFASLSYDDMPFVLAPNLWSKISLRKRHTEARERAHGDNIKVSINSPEAFEEVFWKTFNHKDEENHEKFKSFINCILNKYQKKRYLSKNNQNIRRLGTINRIFPNSHILIPFREPIQHSYSLLTQHKKFIQKSTDDKFVFDYMEWIGHTEFGMGYECIHQHNLIFKDTLDINHWIEQWYLTYKDFLKLPLKNKNYNLVCYELLCLKKYSLKNVLNLLDIKKEINFEFKESIKEINEQTDIELVSKCKSIYDQMIKISL